MRHAFNHLGPPIERNDVDNIAMEERLFPGYLRSTLGNAARDPQTSELVHAAVVHTTNQYPDPAQDEAFLEGVAFAIEARRRADSTVIQ